MLLPLAFAGVGVATSWPSALPDATASGPAAGRARWPYRRGRRDARRRHRSANAATIAAVGSGAPMPEQAMVVALATAMQESKLENLAGGDRDSIGLFQQRPSQGWGTAEQHRRSAVRGRRSTRR